jgi:hypothetical protein
MRTRLTLSLTRMPSDLIRATAMRIAPSTRRTCLPTQRIDAPTMLIAMPGDLIRATVALIALPATLTPSPTRLIDLRQTLIAAAS